MQGADGRNSFVYVMKLLRNYLQTVIPIWMQMADDSDASVGNSGIKSNENVLLSKGRPSVRHLCGCCSSKRRKLYFSNSDDMLVSV
jgi:hypothetical protein